MLGGTFLVETHGFGGLLLDDSPSSGSYVCLQPTRILISCNCFADLRVPGGWIGFRLELAEKLLTHSRYCIAPLF
jgi:hypothetical protein